MSKKFLAEKFKNEELTEKEQRQWITTNGDIELYKSIESDERQVSIQKFDNPENFSEFYNENKFKYMEDTQSEYSDEDIYGVKHP